MREDDGSPMLIVTPGSLFGSRGAGWGHRDAAAARILRLTVLTLLENNRALLIIFACKLAGYFGEWPPAVLRNALTATGNMPS